jgi:hypothetical protein
MKMIYLAIAVLIAGGLICFFAIGSPDARASRVAALSGQRNDVANQNKDDNPYSGLRNMALGMTADQLQLTIPASQTQVYGVVMDWDVGSGIATLSSYATGDASMYLSSGGGMIGGGQHEKVSTAAKAFVDKAQTYLAKASKTDATPLPDKDCVRFYFLTNKGRFSAQEQLQKFDNNSSSAWLPLFEKGNQVIAALRELHR